MWENTGQKYSEYRQISRSSYDAAFSEKRYWLPTLMSSSVLDIPRVCRGLFHGEQRQLSIIPEVMDR